MKGILAKMKRIEKNLKFRNIVLILMFLEVIIVYLMNYIGIRIGVINNFGILHIVSVFIRLILNYLCVFFIWTPLRYEEYREGNPSTRILGWTIVSILEYLFFIVCMIQLEFNKFLLSLFLYTCVFLMIRQLVNRNKIQQKIEFVGQIEKDFSTGILLIGFFSLSNILCITTYLKTAMFIAITIVVSSCIVSICYGMYFLKTKQKILNAIVDKREKITFVLVVSLMHIYYFISALCLDKCSNELLFIIKIIFIFLSVLINALYINEINKVTIINKDVKLLQCTEYK